jgi:phosphoglycolate phosphatase-like HAD superfamily hydrolase
MIEAVLFDGDQTLWDFEKVRRVALDTARAELLPVTTGHRRAPRRHHHLVGATGRRRGHALIGRDPDPLNG